MPDQNKQSNKGLRLSLAATRILIGLIFLWAFFDKLIGLGFSTPAERSWLNGGSPTFGFLSSTEGPFAGIFHSLAGNTLVDWLFMIGLLGIGIGLTLGIAMRISTMAGVAMMILMWMASLPIATNPVLDDHIVYAAILVALFFGMPLQKCKMANAWRRLPVIKDNYWLQ